ncbi:hypothetical protein CDG78_30320, partial [Pseudomonas paraeruginosa]
SSAGLQLRPQPADEGVDQPLAPLALRQQCIVPVSGQAALADRPAADSGGAQLRQLHLADPGRHRRSGRGHRLASPGGRPAGT